MNVEEKSRTASHPWLWLMIAVVTGFFSSGKWVMPLAAWLSPIFIMRFLQIEKGWRGFFLFVVVGYSGFVVTQYKLIPVPDQEFYVAALVAVLIGYVPYALHRFGSRVQAFWGTLVFPASVVSLEFLLSKGPYGTWGSLANTQHGNLTLIQIASITGIWGVVFLMSWTTSCVNWAWARDFRWPIVRRPVVVFFLIVSAVLVYGQVRLFVQQPRSEHVKVATIATSTPAFSDPRVSTYISALRHGDQVTEAAELGFLNAMNERMHEQLHRSRAVADTGAKIVYWSELSVATLPSLEDQLIRQGAQLATEKQIHLGMSFGSVRDTSNHAFIENKIILVGPDGQPQPEYLKSRIPPGEPSIAGDGEVPIITTQHATIANVICFDTDFPSLMRQPGRANAGIVFAPSNDWKEAAGPHMAVASFRAIENGFSLVRATSNGISGAIDYLGNVKGETNSFLSDTRTLTAELPARGVTTIYSTIGDIFAWLCVGFLGIAIPYCIATTISSGGDN